MAVRLADGFFMPGSGRVTLLGRLVIAAATAACCGCGQTDLPASGSGGAGGLDGGAGVAGALGTSCPVVEEPVLVAKTTTTSYIDTAAQYLALDETHVNFSEPAHGTVSRVPRCGGEVQTLVKGQDTPLQIAVDVEDVHWVNGGSTPTSGQLLRLAKGGGTAVVVANGLRQPWGLAMDDVALYADTHQGILRYLKASPSPGVKVAAAAAYPGIAVDETHVYWPTARAPKQGGDAVLLAAASGTAWCVAVDGESLFWTEYTHAVWRVPKAGGPKVQILPDGPWRCIAVDAQHVYAASDIGVSRVAKDGTDQKVFQPGGVGIAVDDEDVFWANDEGIWRVSK